MLKPALICAALFTGGVLAVWALSGPAKAQEPQCVPYDLAIERLAAGGITVQPDIQIGDRYEVNALIVGTQNGFAYAMPMIDGCVVIVEPIPLGKIRDKGQPA